MGLFDADAHPIQFLSSFPYTGPGGCGQMLNNTSALSLDWPVHTTQTTGGQSMHYQITRKNKKYVFEIIAPCFDEDDISVSIDRKNIHVTRTKHERKGDKVYNSYGFDADTEATLDIGIKEYELNWKKADSKYENGIITITIPRLSPAIELLKK